MSGAVDNPFADLGHGPWEIQQFYWQHFECDQCDCICLTEASLWVHIQKRHPNVLPQSAEDQKKLRAEKKALCRRPGYTLTPDESQEVGRASGPSATERAPEIRKLDRLQVSQEERIAVVNTMYPWFVEVEGVCQDRVKSLIDACSRGGARMNDETWRTLIKLHNFLLEIVRDFLLETQHPSTYDSLGRLAAKYQIPTRTWDVVRNFLDFLRFGLPHSREHMIGFILLSYGFMGYMCEAFPEFQVTWLGATAEIASYQMQIEDIDDIGSQERWAKIAREGYSKLVDSDKMSCVGRLYYQLSGLSKPDILAQLFYYCKSLDAVYPYLQAKESTGIPALFASISALDDSDGVHVDTMFVHFHGINFNHIVVKNFGDFPDPGLFFGVLDHHIRQPHSEWKVSGSYMAVCNITGLYKYGVGDSFLRLETRGGGIEEDVLPHGVDCDFFNLSLADLGLEHGFDLDDPDLDGEPDLDLDINFDLAPQVDIDFDPDINLDGAIIPPPPPLPKTWREICVGSETQRGSAASAEETSSLRFSKLLAYGVLRLTLRHTEVSKVLPHIHVWLAFLAYIANFILAMHLLENEFPWEGLVFMLNNLLEKHKCDRFENPSFPVPEEGTAAPLPEDYVIRGLDWASKYFPIGWFQAAQGKEDRELEQSWMEKTRIERILWLAVRISTKGEWLVYTGRHFEIHPALAQVIQDQKAFTAQQQFSPLTPVSASKLKRKSVIIGEGYYKAGGRSRKKSRASTNSETSAGPAGN